MTRKRRLKRLRSGRGFVVAVLEKRQLSNLLPNTPHQKAWVVVSYESSSAGKGQATSSKPSIFDDDLDGELDDPAIDVSEYQVYDLDELLADSSGVSEVVDWGVPKGREVW